MLPKVSVQKVLLESLWVAIAPCGAAMVVGMGVLDGHLGADLDDASGRNMKEIRRIAGGFCQADE